MKTCKFNCSGCNAFKVLIFNSFERFYLWIKRANCYRCYFYFSDLEMCAKIGCCSICRCNYYTKRNNRCMKFKKSKW